MSFSPRIFTTCGTEQDKKAPARISAQAGERSGLFMDCPGSGQISEDQLFTVSVFDQAAFDAVNGGAIEQAANGNGKQAVRGNGDPVRAF